MAIDIMHLNKAMKLCALQEQALTSAIRRELREERRRLDAEGGGGDFYSPFWSDAKSHVVGIVNLNTATESRIAVNGRRYRLYPLLRDGFLQWFEELRRSTNERIGWMEERVHNHYPVPGLELVLKVDNLLGLRIGTERHRLVYPYFAEAPALSQRWARIGLWLMSEALPNFSVTEMEILDVMRGRSFSGQTLFFRGDEEAVFAARYNEICNEWERLRPEYRF
jgi:hypothetical protein